uniref:Uncharacterized protein n=1 Tax=Glossina brevipalpis TaxID=37001 RepID=A0A1A9WRM1_9MUSC
MILVASMHLLMLLFLTFIIKVGLYIRNALIFAEAISHKQKLNTHPSFEDEYTNINKLAASKKINKPKCITSYRRNNALWWLTGERIHIEQLFSKLNINSPKTVIELDTIIAINHTMAIFIPAKRLVDRCLEPSGLRIPK